MTQRKFARLALTTAILTVLSPVAFATDVASDPQQQTPGAAPAKNAADAAKTETQSLEGMVVTGIATSGGVKKLDASYSITAINAEQIKQANPKSTADL
ncbi:MAG: TonB-dependent receptor, partial [Gammaproteobacteria bacterium]